MASAVTVVARAKTKPRTWVTAIDPPSGRPALPWTWIHGRDREAEPPTSAAISALVGGRPSREQGYGRTDDSRMIRVSPGARPPSGWIVVNTTPSARRTVMTGKAWAAVLFTMNSTVS